jgi:hypothetical protein
MTYNNDVEPEAKKLCKYCSVILLSTNVRKVICESNNCKRERMREYMKKYRKNPKHRKKEKEDQIEYRRKKREDPEYREKQRQYIKEYRLKKKGKLL